jgi:hypothetical protein
MRRPIVTSKANGVRGHDQLSDRPHADFLATQKFIDGLAGTKPIYTLGTIRWLERVVVSSAATLSRSFFAASGAIFDRTRS